MSDINVTAPAPPKTPQAVDVRHQDAMCVNRSEVEIKWWANAKYLAAGVAFGIILYKSEVINWFRIQEMFRLQSFHMYGVIGSAIAVGMLSVFLIKKFNVKTIHGEKIDFPDKRFTKGQVIGGLIFGLGWAMTGACPGPILAQIGTGLSIAVVILVSAIAGTWTYGFLREKLPN